VDWINRHPNPPVIFAAYQRTISRNMPSPFMGFVYQDGAVCDWWELGGVRHAFPANHLALIGTHRESCSAEIRGKGGLWICTFTLAGWEGRKEAFQRYQWMPYPIRDPSRLCYAYREVAFQFMARRHSEGLFLKAALLHFFGVVLEELDPEHSARPPIPTQNTKKALEFLHASYSQPRVSLDAAASAAGFSVDHFGRVFQRDMGMSPMKYLRSLRMAQSQKMLESTDLRVREVAREVGFSDSLHFSRVFHRATGMSPRQYRVRWRRKQEAVR
jgi:AraC-like DNA-binding protein